MTYDPALARDRFHERRIKPRGHDAQTEAHASRSMEAPAQRNGDAEIRKRFAPTTFKLPEAADIAPRRWLYDRHLVAGFVSLTVAPGGLGKSSLLVLEALAMVTGRPLLGAKPPRPLRVWLWNGEDPADEIKRRVTAACVHHGISSDDIGDRLFTDSGRDASFEIASAGRDGVVVNRPAVEAAIEAVQRLDLDVLIVDPFATTHSVPENDNVAINTVLGAWREIAHRTGAAVELVHHAQKAAQLHGGELGVSQSRGASALIDAVRSARFLVGMTASEASKAGLDRPHGLFRVELGKANLAPKPERAEWRRIVSVPLNNGSDRYPDGDYVGVVEPWSWPDPLEGLDDETLIHVQTALVDGEGRADEQANDWAGHRIAEVLGLDVGPRTGRTDKQKAERARVKQLIQRWLTSGALRRETRHSSRDGRPVPFIVPGEEGRQGTPAAESARPHPPVRKGAEGAEIPDADRSAAPPPS